MKRCPECRRDYQDDTLNFCLDDGKPLVDGPRSTEAATEFFTAPANNAPLGRDTGAANMETAILPSRRAGRLPQKLGLLAAFAGIAVIASLLVYFYFSREHQTARSETLSPTPLPNAALYWEMGESEQMDFIAQRSQDVQTLIGDQKAPLDEDALTAIKAEIDYYVKRKDSLSQKQYEEGLRAVYGRGTQYAPLIIRAYEKNGMSPALGLYQAMVESEFHDCPPARTPHGGPVGMFQFSRPTAEKYGLTPADYCNVDKQADAAARHMSDLASDFGEGNSNASLGLLSYMYGAEDVRDFLRQLRRQGVTERSFWSIFRNRDKLDPPLQYLPPDSVPQPISLQDDSLTYVPRFFAAAIIGETPKSFDLSTPPLTTVVK